MNKRLISVIVTAVILFPTFGCGHSRNRTKQPKRSVQIALAAQGLLDGAEFGSLCYQDSRYQERIPKPNAYLGGLLYSRYCEQCHKSTATAPKIIETRDVSDAKSDYYIIEYGFSSHPSRYPAAMPSFRSRLTRFQMLDVLAHLGHQEDKLTEISNEVNNSSKMGRIQSDKSSGSQNKQGQD